jgi:NADH dehydrogenase FAD-containing subunit
MSAIGHNRAVARVYGVNLFGFIPWLLWRGFYLLYIPTLARKARLYLEEQAHCFSYKIRAMSKQVPF